MDGALVEISEPEVRINFLPNTKCRATVHLRSLSSTTPLAFKLQTSSPHKFLVNPPVGLIPPSSSTSFQIILRPQSHLPPSFPRSPSDRFLLKTTPFHLNLNLNLPPDSLPSFFASLPRGSTFDFKLKIFFVGPFLLRHAVTSGDVESARSLIKKQKSLLSELSQREAESLLRVATELPNSESMVNLLLEAGLNIDPRVNELLSHISNLPTRHADLVTRTNGRSTRELGDSKWESKGWSELHVAVVFDRTDEVMNLVKGFGSLDLRDKEGRTALHLAVSRGNIECAKVLVESGADKDAKGKDGRTALHRAAANGELRMVEMLIEMGADPTVQDNHGRSAIDAARDKGHEEIVEILVRGDLVLTAARRGDLEHLKSLLRRGARMNYCDQYGFTALHAAAIKGHKDIVEVLYEFGVDLECQDNGGHAALHLAVEGGSFDTVKALVNRGANVNAKSKNGVTPLYMAKVIGYDDIWQFLTTRGASSSPPPSSATL